MHFVNIKHWTSFIKHGLQCTEFKNDLPQMKITTFWASKIPNSRITKHIRCGIVSMLIHWRNLIFKFWLIEYCYYFMVHLRTFFYLSDWIFKEIQSMSIQLHWILNTWRIDCNNVTRKHSLNWTSHFTFIEIRDMRHETWHVNHPNVHTNIENWKDFPNSIVVCRASVLSLELFSVFNVFEFEFIVNEFWMTMLSTFNYQLSAQNFEWKDEISFDSKYLSFHIMAFRIIRRTAFAFQNLPIWTSIVWHSRLNWKQHNISFRSTIEFGHLFWALFCVCVCVFVNRLLCIRISSLNTSHEIHRNELNERMNGNKKRFD